jgi:hypothetical protein
LAEEPHQSLDVLRSRGQEELLPHELQSPQAQATQTNLMLEFREQGFYFFSLPLRVSELRRVGQLASTLSGQLIHVDSQIFISSTRASCFLRAGSATFGAANVSVSTIANIQPNVVELFPSRTAIAVAFWLIGKTLRSVEGAVLALCTLSRPHVSGDFPLCQPLQRGPHPAGALLIGTLCCYG